MGSRVDKFDIDHELHDEIKCRLAPLYFEQYIVQAGYLSAGAKARHPLTRIDKIITYCEHPTEFTTISSTSKIIPKLWYASVTGCLSSTSIEALQALGISSVSRTCDENSVGELINIGVHNSSNLT